MADFKHSIGDTVTCPRLGIGNFKIISNRMTSSAEVQLQNVNTGETEWIYEIHCFTDIRLKKLNINNRNLKREAAVSRILNKPKRKR